jgi:hypothetical protein
LSVNRNIGGNRGHNLGLVLRELGEHLESKVR